MAAPPPGPVKIDRQTTTPFLLKLFYKTSSFHHLDDFVPGASSSELPHHLQIYTWPTCSLRELTQLLTSALPNILPSPAAGTRIAFRLVFPDTRASMVSPNQPGRYLTKDLGSVVVGTDLSVNGTSNGSSGSISGSLEGDTTKTLQDARFVIGDYVSCAIMQPLPSGATAPPPPALLVSGRGGYGGGPPRGAYMDGTSYRGRGGRGGYISSNVPSGEWRRGERIPDDSRYGGGRNRGGRRP